MNLTRRERVGLIVAAIGVLIFVAGNCRTWIYGFAPVDVPLPIRTGDYTYQFTTGFAAEYEVQVVAERTLAPELLDCLLYTRTLWHKVCSDQEEALRADWRVSGNNRLIERGSSEESGSIGLSQNSNRGTPEGDREATVIIRRGMGLFRAKGLHSYDLKITMLTDNSPLAPANPRLQIQMYLADRESVVAMGWMSSLLGILCVAICLMLSTDLAIHRIAIRLTASYGGIVALLVGYNCVVWTLVAYYPDDYDIDVGFTGDNIGRFWLLLFLIVVPASIAVFVLLSRFLRHNPNRESLRA